MKISIIIATYKRPEYLCECLDALDTQITPKDEIILVIRSEDAATLKALENYTWDHALSEQIHIVLIQEPGIVAAENRGLQEASGDIVALIDDDAIAQEHWLERIRKHYENSHVGAVGGPAIPYIEGKAYPKETRKPCLRKTWYGRHIGNTELIPHQLRKVHILRGCNMSFRRHLVDGFDLHLKPYWRRFEDDAILGVGQKGFDILYDPAIQVWHHTAPIQEGQSREQNKESIIGSHHNNTYVLLKHSGFLKRCAFLIFTFVVGDTANLGILGYLAKGLWHRQPKQMSLQLWWALQGKWMGIQTYKHALNEPLKS